MSKQIAILEYEIIFDPSETWSNGYQFENQLADFFGAHGYEAQFVEAKGGTGKRVIFLERQITISDIAKQAPQPKESKPATQQIKKVQQNIPTKSFKEFRNRGVPKSFVNQDKRAPQLQYQQGRTNRMKVRMP